MYRVGIDVGGTFTDLVPVDDAGRTVLEKVPSTPDDPSIGVLDGLERLARATGRDRSVLLTATERIVHGTTVATNALLERKGARVGLMITAGHRDVIEMREGLKDDRYNLRMRDPLELLDPAAPQPTATHRRREARARPPHGSLFRGLDRAKRAGSRSPPPRRRSSTPMSDPRWHAIWCCSSGALARRAMAVLSWSCSRMARCRQSAKPGGWRRARCCRGRPAALPGAPMLPVSSRTAI